MKRSRLRRALSVSTRFVLSACAIAAAPPRLALAIELAGRTPTAPAGHDPFRGVLHFLAPEPASRVAHLRRGGHHTAYAARAQAQVRVSLLEPPRGHAWRLATFAWRFDHFRAAARHPPRAYADAVSRYPRLRVVQTRVPYLAYPPPPYAYGPPPYAYAPYPPYYPFIAYVLPDPYGYAGY